MRLRPATLIKAWFVMLAFVVLTSGALVLGILASPRVPSSRELHLRAQVAQLEEELNGYKARAAARKAKREDPTKQGRERLEDLKGRKTRLRETLSAR